MRTRVSFPMKRKETHIRHDASRRLPGLRADAVRAPLQTAFTKSAPDDGLPEGFLRILSRLKAGAERQ